MIEISEKQLEANRQNAKLGGVKTEEGKAISRYNAIKHGLLSIEVLLDGEDEKILIEVGQRLRMELEPKTELELVLVDRITANVWRLKRVLRIERDIIEKEFCDDNFGNYKGKGSLGEALSFSHTNNDTYGKLIRYETSIERGIYKALHELQRIQAVRLGEKILAPMAVDVDISNN